MDFSKVIAIVGPNASGKSSIGLELAQRFNGEIVSADSRQVYKGFDLCCGKVTAEETQIVPHHLLDVRNLDESFSLADYQDMAYTAITKILDREKIPFIVGGTGLYVESIVYGYVLPREEADAEMREKLGKLSVEELRDLLTPEGEAFLNENYSDANNKRRIIRVIEKTAQGCPLNNEKAPKYNALQIGTAWPKEKLHQRIDERLESRIRDGMIDEIKRYLDNGGSQDRLYSLGLEYRYILLYLTGKFKSFDEFKLELSRAIKRFAKRQMTWFRRDKTINWIDMESDYLEQARLVVENFLENSMSACT